MTILLIPTICLFICYLISRFINTTAAIITSIILSITVYTLVWFTSGIAAAFSYGPRDDLTFYSNLKPAILVLFFTLAGSFIGKIARKNLAKK